MEQINVGLFKGKLIDINNLDNKEIDVAEFARTLQRIPRYNGHSDFEWTVAQHSLLVQKILKDHGYQADIQLAGLLHDVSEAYINDVIRPIKVYLTQYFVYEAKVENQIIHKFGLLDLEKYPEYKMADDLALYAEQINLIGLDNDWVRQYPEDFKNPEIFKYGKLVKQENSQIVMGKFLVRLFKLVEELNSKNLDDSIREQEWFKILKSERKQGLVPILGIADKIIKAYLDEETDSLTVEISNKKYKAQVDILKNIKDLEVIMSDTTQQIFNILFKEC